MDCCIGIIIITIVVVGGSLIYGYFAAEVARRKRASWARALDNATLPELERLLHEMEIEEGLYKEKVCLFPVTNGII
jgi:hypothetical protein